MNNYKIYSAIILFFTLTLSGYAQSCCCIHRTPKEAVDVLIAELDKGESGNWGNLFYDVIKNDSKELTEIENKYIPQFEKLALTSSNGDFLYNLGEYFLTKSFLDKSGTYISKAEKYLLQSGTNGNANAWFLIAENIYSENLNKYIEYMSKYYSAKGKLLSRRYILAKYYKNPNATEEIDELCKKYLNNVKFDIDISLLYVSGKLGSDKTEYGIENINKLYSTIISDDNIDERELDEAAVLYVLFNSGVYGTCDNNKALTLYDYSPDKIEFLRKIKNIYDDGYYYLLGGSDSRIFFINPEKSKIEKINEQIVLLGGNFENLRKEFKRLFNDENEQNVLQNERTPQYISKLKKLIPIVDNILKNKKSENYDKSIGIAILIQLGENERICEYIKNNTDETPESMARAYMFLEDGFCGDKQKILARDIIDKVTKLTPKKQTEFYIQVANEYDNFLIFDRLHTDNTNKIIKYLECGLKCGGEFPYSYLVSKYIDAKNLRDKYIKAREVINMALADKNISSVESMWIADIFLRGEIIEPDYSKIIPLLKHSAADKHSFEGTQARFILSMIYAISAPPIRNKGKSEYWFGKFKEDINTSGLFLQTLVLPHYFNFETTRERYFPDNTAEWNAPLEYAHEKLDSGFLDWAYPLGYSLQEMSDYTNAEKVLIKGADAGFSKSAFLLAKFYLKEGPADKIDYNKAIKYAKIQLKNSYNNDWQRNESLKIIVLSYKSMGDCKSAFEFAKEHMQDYNIFKEFVARCYKFGIGTEKNIVESKKIFTEIDNNEDTVDIACEYELGDKSLFGDDIERQKELLRNAIEKSNNQYAIFTLSSILIKNAKSFTDEQEGFNLYKKIKKDFWSNGAFLYYCYKNGIGVKKNEKKALEVEENIKINSTINDILCIAGNFESGFDYIREPDLKESLHWYEFAARNGNSIAKNKIAELKGKNPDLR